MKTHSFRLNFVVVVALSLLTMPSYASFTRTEAFNYLTGTILSTSSPAFVSRGSSVMVSANSQIFSSSTQVLSPSFKSWMFMLDEHPSAMFGHNVNYYFIDVENLNNYTMAVSYTHLTLPTIYSV